MAQQATLSANGRTTAGKGIARSLRRDGRVPAVIYGRGRTPEPLSLDAIALERLLARVRASTTLVDLTVDDRQPIKALIREIQRDPVRPSNILHIDLYEVHANEKLTVEVPIHFIGTADGVKNSGGVFEPVSHTLQIRVLPANIPERIEVDVNALGVGMSLHVSDLKLENMDILTDQGVTLCTVGAAKAEEAPVVVEAVASPTEPELIRKPKPEDDEAPAKS